MFLTNFKSVDDIVSEYGETAEQKESIHNDLEGATIHVAWYGYGFYDGSSVVIYEKNGKLWEVNGSHCSCFGLEGQWKPEETSWAALGMRKWESGDTSGDTEAKDEIMRLVHLHKRH